MKKKVVEIGPSLIFMTFQGEFVNIYLRKDIETTSEQDGQLITTKMPMNLEGFLMDEDDNHYFLGDDGLNSNKAIPKDMVMFIEIVKLPDPLTQILDEMPSPSSKKEFN